MRIILNTQPIAKLFLMPFHRKWPTIAVPVGLLIAKDASFQNKIKREKQFQGNLLFIVLKKRNKTVGFVM